MTEAKSEGHEEALPIGRTVDAYLHSVLEYLCDMESVACKLVRDEIITENERQQIINRNTPLGRRTHLISILRCKWPEARNEFVKILAETRNVRCLHMIEGKFQTDTSTEHCGTNTSNEPRPIQSTNQDSVQNFCVSLRNISSLGVLVVFMVLILLFLNALAILLYYFNSDVNTTKINLAKYLVSISGVKTISGIFLHSGMVNSGEIEYVSRITSRLPGILSSSMPDPDSNEKWKCFIHNTILQSKNGFLVHVGWLGESHPLEKLATDDESNFEDLITDGGSLNKKWKEILDFVATHLRELEKAGVVVMFDPLPYINNKSHFWRGRPGINGTLKLYEITHNYMTQTQRLNSLMWSWSLLYTQGEVTYLKKYLPGNEYIDVVTVYLLDPYGDKLPDGKTYSDELGDDEYLHLINTVGEKPISINRLKRIPTPKLLTRQPRWVWFTIDHKYLNDKDNNQATIKATFRSTCVINKNDIDISQNNFIKTPKSSRQC